MKKNKILIIIFSIFLSLNCYASVTKEVLNNGLIILAKEDNSSNIVAIDVFIKTGSLYEDDRNAGITNFVQKLLLKGTKSKTGLQIDEEIEKIGGVIDTTTSADYAEVYLVILNKYLDKGIELLFEILLEPSFPEEEVEKTRKEIIEEIKTSEDNLFESIDNLFCETLYEKHPYHKPILGYKNTIEKIKRKELIDFYKNYYAPNNIIISCAGNFKKKEIIEKIKNRFSSLQIKKVSQRKESIEIKNLKEKEVIKEKETQAAWLILGFLATSVNSEDYPVLKVIDSILGRGMSSRLFAHLRDRLSLAYEIGSFFPTRLEKSIFATYIITNPYKLEKAKSGILWEIAKIKQLTVDEEEIKKAKNYLKGSFILDHEKSKKAAFYLGFYELLGLGYDFDEKYIEKIEEVTSEDIKKVAQKYFKNYTIAIIKPKGAKTDIEEDVRFEDAPFYEPIEE